MKIIKLRGVIGMVIKSKTIIDSLNYVIEELKTSGIIINPNTGEIDENELPKIKYFIFQKEFESDENLEEDLKELAYLLSLLKLDYIDIYIYTKDRKPKKTNIELIDSLNKDIKAISISGIDMSGYNSGIFSQFKELEDLRLQNTNLSNLEIVSNLNPNVHLGISNNPIEKNISENTIRILKKHQSFINFNNRTVYHGDIGELKIYSTKDIDIDTLKRCTDIDRISLQRYIYASNIFASPIDTSLYTRDEFIKIKQEINDIIEQVKFPNNDDPDKEKKIFMQVYRILGEKIRYNHSVLSNEENNEDAIKRSQNLIDGLTKNTCICAGYAQILESVLDELGIKSNIIHRFPADKINFVFSFLEYNNSNYISVNDWQIEALSKILQHDDKLGHAWNVVYLDNNAYLCDLTWDADNIKNGHFPLLNCCCSLQNFMKRGHYRYDDTSYHTNISEISNEEQLRLFGFSELEIKQILNESEKKCGEQQIENCVQSVATEIKSSDFEGLEEKLTMHERTNEKRGGANYDGENR